MRFPLRYKLRTIILVILVPMLLFSSYQFTRIMRDEKARIANDNFRTARDVARDLDVLLAQTLSVLEVTALFPEVTKQDSERCHKLFSRVLTQNSLYLNILAARMDGSNCGSAIEPVLAGKLNYMDREWFLQARQGKSYVGDVHTTKLLKRPAVMVAVPVKDGGRQVGVLGVSLALDGVGATIEEMWHLPPGSEITVIDSKGRVITNTLGRFVLGKDLSNEGIVHLALTTEAGKVDQTSDVGETDVYAYCSLEKADWRVIVRLPADEAYRNAYTMSLSYIFIALLIAAAAYALSTFISSRITSQIKSLAAGLQQIEQGNFDVALQKSGNDELTDVAASFNKMIEERLKGDRRLRESKRFLNSVLDGIGEGVVVIDRNYRIISANRAFCHIGQAEEKEIVGRFCYEVSHHRSTPCFEGGDEVECECAVKKCFETGTYHRSIHTHRDSKGNVIHIETNAYPIYDDSGAITSAIETMVDVSERVMLERSLQEAIEKYRKLYDDAPDMMHSLDSEGRIIICNRTEASMLGYELEEMIGSSFLQFIAPEERFHGEQKFSMLIKKGSYEGELTLVTKDGQHIPVLVKSKVITDSNGNILMSDAVMRDITEKRLLEAQLLHAQKMEAVGTLAGGIAHDFNNLLTAILGYGSLLKSDIKEDEEKLQHCVSHILSAAERAAGLTQSLLAFSRKQPLRPKLLDLNSVISNVEKLLSRVIGEHIELQISLASRPLVVMADSGQLDQIVVNLVANSRDAMPGGGIINIETSMQKLTEEYFYTHGPGKPGFYAVLSVSDNGMGMDERVKGRVFEPFFTTKEVGKGTGLGLSIVYGIVKQHDAYLDVYSEPGKGTNFTIYFPLVAQEELAAEEAVITNLPRGTETILVAEDDPEVRALTVSVLSAQGYSVLAAKDGEEALGIFAKHKQRIHAVILDVVMPKQNGKEVHAQMVKEVPELKVIFTSGYTAGIIRENGVAEEEFTFISKPFAPHHLLTLVHNLLHGETFN